MIRRVLIATLLATTLWAHEAREQSITPSGGGGSGGGGGPTTLTGDCTGSGTGTVTTTCAKLNGVSVPSNPSTNKVPVVTGSNTITYQDAAGLAATTGFGTMLEQNASGVAITGGTINGAAVTGLANPSASGDATPKSYVDAAVTGSILHTQVAAATAAVLPNSPVAAGSGVGKTLTSGSNAALVVDGYTVLLNDRVLVKNQATASDNGIYTQTTLGTGSVKWVLTRATDFDQAAAGEVALGAYVLVANGTTNAGSTWQLGAPTPSSITVDTTSLTFNQLNASTASAVTTASTPSANVIPQFTGSGKAVADNGLLTGTSGATVPLNNGNNTFSGSLTLSGSVSSSGAITVKGQPSQPPCAVAVSSHAVNPDMNACAADGTKGTGNSVITISEANDIIYMPTNLVAGTTFFFDIVHTTTGDTLGFGPGFKWAGGWPPYCSGSITAGCISQVPAEDMVTCTSMSSTLAICSPPLQAIQQYTYTTSPAFESACGSGTSCATSGTFTVYPGQTIIAGIGYCPDSGCAASTSVMSGFSKTSGTATVGSCSNAAKDTGSHALKGEIWRCPVTAAGTAVMTATWGAAVAGSGITMMAVWGLAATDDGVGNATMVTTGNSGTIALSGSTSQANEFLFQFSFPNLTAAGCVANTNWTLYDSNSAGGGIYSQSTSINSVGTNSTTVSCPGNGGGSSPIGLAIAAFK